MKKPVIIILLLLFLYITPVYAEEVSSKNTISGGVSIIWAGYPFYILPGMNVEYERLLINNFTLAVDIGLDGLILSYADLKARWYPWNGMFFTDIGLGIWRQGFDTWILTPVISPGFGWKIDIGKPNGWNLTTGIIGRIFFFEERQIDINNSSVIQDFIIDITAKAFFKIGYSF